MTKRILSTLILGLTVAGVACGRGRSGAADTTLNRDLSLAAQQHSLDSLADTARLQSPVTHATTTHRASSPGDVSHTRRRSTGGSSSGSSSGGTVASAPSGGTVVKHTQRDAAIGAAAGAVIGATTSRNKVKGGVIGGVVGGILGGVIGNNVDKQKKP